MGNLEAALAKLSPEARAFLSRPYHKHVLPPYDETRWYVVQVWCREEEKAVDWLKDFHAVVYLPKCKVAVKASNRLSHKQRREARQRGGHLIVERPLFPGYLFIRPAELEVEIDSIPHVRGYLRAGEVPVHLSNAAIALIRAREVGGAIPLAPPVQAYAVSEEVRVCEGPFSGFNGIVQFLLDSSVDSAPRISLLVDLFGRACPVELDLDQIEKL